MAMALRPLASEPRAPEICYPGEAKNLFCYTKPQGTPQNVKVADILYAAKELRAYGTGSKEKLDNNGNPVLDENCIPVEEPVYRFLNMSTSTASGCGEWTIWSDAETVLVTAKLMTTKVNGLVRYEDITTTIEGGEGATAAQQTDTIVSCGTDGGSREVKANTAQTAYDEYIKLYRGEYVAGEIVIKVVQNLDWKNANPGS
ncbi:hypothetical protein B0T24DRAFT_678247 [Lasiosphaeria ovina]|uniref:Uncharacterized protein n=1 Tax=Lasiosphaeria ovina TaxID=92902 RepID=A0AAE0NBJ9_9PEZI|nr:hypothetical protein B0T24DRAFT_678247 [Lasiosphaeria ovina]